VNQVARVDQRLSWDEGYRLKPRHIGGAVAIGVALVICWRAAEIRPGALVEPGTVTSVWAFVRGLFPPDLSPEFLRVATAAAAQTVAIALAATLLSIFIGLPLGVLATPTLWRRGVLLAGERQGARRFPLSALSRTSRALLGFLRAVPDLIWALLFVVAVGLGPLAGVLALAVSYSAMLGRVYADVFEDVDQRALEALHATGATRLQVFLYAVWPQAAASITAYTIYSFECCVRAASVLGFIGAGGIGYEINLSMRMFEYGQVSTLIITLVAVVAATDVASRFLRRRVHAKARASSAAQRGAARDYGSPTTRSLRKIAIPLAVSVLFAWSFYATGFLNGAFSDSAIPARIVRFVSQMFPPNIDPLFLRSLGRPLLQTIGISVMGTLIGIIVGAVLSLPAAGILVLSEKDEAGQNHWSDRVSRWLTYGAARLVLSLLRSIPELVWVLICIIAIGLGPFAGTLAIGFHTGGVLGKLYAETLEEAPAQPIEALRAMGARRLQILLWGIWPQVRPTLVSYTVLRWEMNLRVATILGLIGGGGLGQAIYNNVQLAFYGRVSTLIAIIYVLVITTDWFSDRLRSRRVVFG
jgi:phosphonate transport system permease protein